MHQRALFCLLWLATGSAAPLILDPLRYKQHFVEGWPGPYCNGTGAGQLNTSSYNWTVANLPLFEVSDADIESAYYFRAKTYKSHIIPTGYVDMPYVVSEFGLSVHWGGPFGTINAAAGHHIREGRWIRDRTVMDSLIKFWVGSLSGGDPQLVPHFANGTRGKLGSTPYSTWILSATADRARVLGEFSLGKDVDGREVKPNMVLERMVKWWEARTLQTRLDCVMARATKAAGYEGCATKAPGTFPYPFCYITADGWDAMEKSISGAGCRPTVGAMKFGDALAIAALARQLGNDTLADDFEQRAGWIQRAYLELLWNNETAFFAVYKENLQGNSGYKCAVANQSSSRAVQSLPGCPPVWPCNKTVPVRELLGLGPPFYFEIVPKTASATKYAGMWKQLFDPNGFAGKWGPTTAERRHRCFNMTQGTAECSWNGMSWPYETSRVLTGLSNLLVDYPAAHHKEAGMNATTFTDLLRTYAKSHTQSQAFNGSQPWIGEDIEPDKGYWVAHNIMYTGGEHPTPVNCAECAKDPRPRNCGSYSTVPACCHAEGEDACDGKIIPTPDKDRGKDYNHSSFLDVVISGLIGLRASFARMFSIHPLADASIEYFCLDNVAYHGHNITIAWDVKGERYKANDGCKGFCVWVDGSKVKEVNALEAVNITLVS